MARPFWRHHCDIDVRRRLDQLEMHVETLTEQQRLAGSHRRRDLGDVQVGLQLVRRQHHDHVCLLGGVRHGNDVEEVYRVTREAMKALQSDPTRPAVVEFETWRYYEHCGPGQDDHLGYREEEDINRWAGRDPLSVARERLVAENPLLEKEIESAEQRYTREIDSIIEKVRASAKPDPATLKDGVFAP